MGIAGRRIVVVGASASIGRAVALRAVRSGAEVVAAARRKDRLEELVAEAGGGIPVPTDVRDEESCGSLMRTAGDAVGAIDAVVYTAGYAPLRLMADTTTVDWHEALSTNVTGANQVIRAALPHLVPGAVVVVLSSETVGRPRNGLGAYGSSKAALEESLNAWRNEHPGIRFCSAAIGATWPTEFGNQFDGELLMRVFGEWAVRGLNQAEYMDADELADVLVDTIASLVDHPGIGLERMTLRSPSPIAPHAGVPASVLTEP